jgi:hypothetical protein
MENVKSQLMFTGSIQFVIPYQQTSVVRTECNTADLNGVNTQLPLHHVRIDLLYTHQLVRKQIFHSE